MTRLLLVIELLNNWVDLSTIRKLNDLSIDSIKNSNGPLLIEIEKSPGSSIGIKLNMSKSSANGKNQILVESVKPASIADR